MKNLFTTIAFAFVVLLSTNVDAQKFRGLDASPLDIASSKDKSVKIVYSRPQLKGRALGTLVPNGKMWRTGANEGTEITFKNDMKLGGKGVKAGTYTLTTIPGDNEWTIVLNSVLGTWGGNAGSSYKKETEVARFMAKASTSDDSLEAFSIVFSDDAMNLGWGSIRVSVPFSM